MNINEAIKELKNAGYLVEGSMSLPGKINNAYMNIKEYRALLLKNDIIYEHELGGLYMFTEFARRYIKEKFSNERYKLFKCAICSKNGEYYVYVPKTLENINDAWGYVAVSDIKAYENGVRNMLELFKDYIENQ